MENTIKIKPSAVFALLRSAHEKGYTRLLPWGLASLTLGTYIYDTAIAQIEVLGWKSLMTVGAFYLGYWLDRSAFPYARPHVAINEGNMRLACMCMMRRVSIIAACMLSVSSGL